MTAQDRRWPGACFALAVGLGTLTACAGSSPRASIGSVATSAPDTAQLPTPIGVQPTSPSETTRACQVVTQGDVQAALGHPVDNGLANGTADSSTCVYLVSGQTKAGISVGLVAPGGRAVFEAQQKVLGSTQPVAGVGDTAYSSGAGAIIHALKGDTEVTVNARLATSPEFIAAVSVLIRQAIARV